GLASEWGAKAIRVDVATGVFRKLSGYALELSRDRRVALSGGREAPQTIAAVTLADGRPNRSSHTETSPFRAGTAERCSEPSSRGRLRTRTVRADHRPDPIERRADLPFSLFCFSRAR